ncbi:MAG: tyrosine-type recombinase/integrase [Ignavibacteriales bacterium]
MAVYRKDNRWYIDYYLPDGKRKREIVTIPGVDPSRVTRQDAKKALSIRKGQIAEGKFDIAQTRTSALFEKLSDRYLEYSKTNKRAWKRDLYSIKSFLVYFKGKTLSQITPWLIEKYKSERKVQVKPATINRELATLSNMFSMAVIWKLLDSTPYKGVKHFRVNSTSLRILNEDEFQRLYAAASPTLRPILLAAITTGMRKGELLNLKWDDVNFKEGFILVRDSKNYESRPITIHAKLREILLVLKERSQSEYVFDGRMTLKHHWAKALRKSGIPHCRFHDLRHTFASRLVMEGVDLVTIQELMGHKNINMTKRYSHPTPEHKKQAVERIDLANLDTYLDTKAQNTEHSGDTIVGLTTSNRTRI